MKKTARIGIVLALIAAAGYLYVSRTDGLPGKAGISIQASELAEAYISDEAGSNKKYLGKVLQVSGILRDIEGETNRTVVLQGSGMTNVRVEIPENRIPVSLSLSETEITVRGECSGYLMDVILTNGVIVDD